MTTEENDESARFAKVRAAIDAGVNRAIATQEGAVLRVARLAGYGDVSVSPAAAAAALDRY